MRISSIGALRPEGVASVLPVNAVDSNLIYLPVIASHVIVISILLRLADQLWKIPSAVWSGFEVKGQILRCPVPILRHCFLIMVRRSKGK
jgi:hypothetical protein